MLGRRSRRSLSVCVVSHLTLSSLSLSVCVCVWLTTLCRSPQPCQASALRSSPFSRFGPFLYSPALLCVLAKGRERQSHTIWGTIHRLRWVTTGATGHPELNTRYPLDRSGLRFQKTETVQIAKKTATFTRAKRRDKRKSESCTEQGNRYRASSDAVWRGEIENSFQRRARESWYVIWTFLHESASRHAFLFFFSFLPWRTGEWFFLSR